MNCHTRFFPLTRESVSLIFCAASKSFSCSVINLSVLIYYKKGFPISLLYCRLIAKLLCVKVIIKPKPLNGL